MIDKQGLINYLERKIKSKMKDNEWKKHIVVCLNTYHNVPLDYGYDLITLRINLSDQGENVLYYLHSVIEEKPNYQKYFTDIEITNFAKTKFNVAKIKFPLKLRMVQIADNQWIGKIEVKELIKLRDAQLIKYNENAQRTLKRIVSGGNEYYSIALNRTAVEQIMESFNSDTYIPNAITLNLPEYADYRYDETTSELIIKETDSFDILDGYHRYIAMSNLNLKNKSFNYTMELRIVVFPEEKARQFIWQEDQKTKMSKVDSDSFNQSNAGNQVAQMLNDKGILTGLINRNGGIIDAAVMANVVNIMWFKNVNKKDEKKVIMATRESLYRKFDYVISQNQTLLTKRWTRAQIICTLFACYMEIEESKMCKVIDMMIDKTQSSDIYKGRVFSNSYLNQLTKIYESEVKNYV